VEDADFFLFLAMIKPSEEKSTGKLEDRKKGIQMSAGRTRGKQL
jgi:hypothetical protein